MVWFWPTTGREVPLQRCYGRPSRHGPSFLWILSCQDGTQASFVSILGSSGQASLVLEKQSLDPPHCRFLGYEKCTYCLRPFESGFSAPCSSGFLSLDAVDILGWMILCCGQATASITVYVAATLTSTVRLQWCFPPQL